MYVHREGGETVTAKLTCAARRGPHVRRVGEALVAQSGGGVGTHVLRGLGFQLQVTIPPLPRPNLLQTFCTLQNRIRLQPISTVNSFYKIVLQNCKKRGVKEGKWGSLQWILDVLI